MKSEGKGQRETQAVHGREPDKFAYDAVAAPIVQTATYSFENTAELVAFMKGDVAREEYGRYGNPTVRWLEGRVAELEGAEAGVAFASGMSAVTSAILALTKSGSHIVLFSDCYRRTRQFVVNWLTRFGVEHTLVDPKDAGSLDKVIQKNTRLVITELPTNPYLSVVDLDAVTRVARAHKVRTLVDATFATPLNLRALEHGADLVAHSTTKYLAGHNDVLGGVLVGSGALVSLVREARDVIGGVMDPHAAWLTLRGVKTLPLRVAQHNANGLALARALEGHPRVKRVWYPGLESHPDHTVAKRVMSGFGGVVTFELNASMDETSKFVDSLQLARIAPSFGGVDSLVEQPAIMSFFELAPEERRAIGISDSLVRYSCGIESAGDIVSDVLRALDTV